MYGFDSAEWVIPTNTEGFAYRYLRPIDIAYWQVTDPDRVWQISGSDSVSNVENPDFTFASAQKVTVAAVTALAVSAAALL